MTEQEVFRIHEFPVDQIPDSCSWIIVAPPGGGKCLDPNTKVLMYDKATKKAIDIRKGDYLLGDDMTSRKVLSITSGRDQMYTISQSRGVDYVVNGSHILVFRKEGGPYELSSSSSTSPYQYTYTVP